MDMTEGGILPKLLVFSIPLIASGVLQLLFNAADVIVVGRFAGEESLAAVGSTSSLTNLIINLFIGFSIGANVLAANFYGGKKEKDISDTVHTSILFSLIGGVILTFAGLILSRPMLSLMGTPEDVINHSVTYMRIYFLGMPVMMLYNFGSSILRAVGDTKRPLYYLTIAGVINVVLNLFFVIVLGMGVAGVAIATVVSQAVSGILVLRCLIKAEGAFHLDLKKLRINWKILGKIAAIGLPAGIQGSLFSISNIIIQSSINSFGSVVMAGNTAASNVEGFVYTSMNAVAQTTVSFVGQNAGAKKLKRIRRVIIDCFVLVTVVGLVLGNLCVIFDGPLLGLYSSADEVIKAGSIRLKYIGTLYCTCGIMEVLVSGMRGLGRSIVPTIISLLGACVFRIIYIFTYFANHKSLEILYLSYPISWVITSLAHLCALILIYRSFCRNISQK